MSEGEEAGLKAPVTELFGVVTFGDALHCSTDVLSTELPVSVGGVHGHLRMPSLPGWSGTPEDPLGMPLVGPRGALTWKQGDRLITWGRPMSFPSGYANVEKALLVFDISDPELPELSTKVHQAFDGWKERFEAYFELLTKQRLSGRTWSKQPGMDLDLFCWADKKPRRPHEPLAFTMTVSMPNNARALTLPTLEQLIALTSGGKELSFSRKFQLEAYRALRADDYRKAVIEAGVAAEIALTDAIRRKFATTGVHYGPQLVDKFRMLGRRLELAKMIDVALPTTNLKEALIDRRNDVIHKGTVPSHAQATQAVEALDALLDSLDPIASA